MNEPTLDVSIIVPALNEAANLPMLIERIDAALAGVAYEVIVVDDNSRDGTPGVCETLSRQYPLTLLTRIAPRGGLSGAVLEGLARARGAYLVVMDADLQHPPDRIPALLKPLQDRAADFVLGSRYVAGGTTSEKWGPFRQLNSRVATLLARPFAGATRDPMSGFFAMSRGAYATGRHLTPLGYKIALELMCKCRVAEAAGGRGVREIPIHFDSRAHGESKLTLAQQFKYLEHLSRLYDFHFPRVSPMLKFLIVTGLGWLVALSAFLALVLLLPQAWAPRRGSGCRPSVTRLRSPPRPSSTRDTCGHNGSSWSRDIRGGRS